VLLSPRDSDVHGNVPRESFFFRIPAQITIGALVHHEPSVYLARARRAVWPTDRLKRALTRAPTDEGLHRRLVFIVVVGNHIPSSHDEERRAPRDHHNGTESDDPENDIRKT